MEFKRAVLFLVFLYSLVVIVIGTPLSSEVNLSKHPKLVVFSYDGFRFDYMTKTNTPNLDFIKENGVSTAYMTPQFATFTFPNHQSLSTGLNTQSHGVIANSVWDPYYGRVLSGYDNHIEFWKFNEEVYPLWTLNEWAGDGRKSGTQFPGSDQPHGPNNTLPTYSLSYDGDRPYEDRMDFVVDWLTDETNPANLIFMYFDEPDHQGHEYGPNSEEVRLAIERMDEITGYFLDKLRELQILDQVNLIFWSDHGMEEVDFANTIDINGMVDNNLYDRYGSSPVVQIWPKDETNTETIYEQFRDGSQNLNFTVYKKADLPEIWRYADNRRVPAISLVSDPGYVFSSAPSGKEETHFKRPENKAATAGFHGYDNRNPNMRPFFLAHGPVFRNGVEIEPFENVDLFPLICHLMGFAAPGNNGTLSHVEAALRPKLRLSPDRTNTTNAAVVSAFASIYTILGMASALVLQVRL